MITIRGIHQTARGAGERGAVPRAYAAAGATEEVIRGHALNHARHEYNTVEPDEMRSYTEMTTPTEDTNPREPGPPLEFGTSTPRSQQ